MGCELKTLRGKTIFRYLFWGHQKRNGSHTWLPDVMSQLPQGHCDWAATSPGCAWSVRLDSSPCSTLTRQTDLIKQSIEKNKQLQYRTIKLKTEHPIPTGPWSICLLDSAWLIMGPMWSFEMRTAGVFSGGASERRTCWWNRQAGGEKTPRNLHSPTHLTWLNWRALERKINN